MATITTEIKLNMPRILNKVESDEFGLKLAHEWKRLLNPYTPHRTGNMERNVVYRPFEIEYMEPYSQYQYYGKLYVDPIYQVGGFTKDGGITWFSRKGVKKVATVKPLNYLKDHNPLATSEWDKAAEKAGQKEKLVRIMNRYLNKL